MNNQKARIVIILMFLLFCFLSPVFADPPKWLACIEDIVKWWHILLWISLGVTIFTGLLGIVIGGVQPLQTKHLKKITVILGIVVSSMVFVKETFIKYDYTTMASLHKKGKLYLADIYDLMDKSANELDTQLKSQYEKKIREIKNKIIELDEQYFLQNSKSSDHSVDDTNRTVLFISQAYAQPAKRPSWITKPPSDSLNKFFVGRGTGSTIDTAQKKAAADASRKVAQHFSQGYDKNKNLLTSPVSKNKLIAYLAESIIQADQYTEKNNSAYTVYILVKVNTRIIKSDLYMFEDFKTKQELNEKFINGMSQTEY